MSGAALPVNKLVVGAELENNDVIKAFGRLTS